MVKKLLHRKSHHKLINKCCPKMVTVMIANILTSKKNNYNDNKKGEHPKLMTYIDGNIK
jgi:hypothetical protein